MYNFNYLEMFRLMDNLDELARKNLNNNETLTILGDCRKMISEKIETTYKEYEWRKSNNG